MTQTVNPIVSPSTYLCSNTQSIHVIFTRCTETFQAKNVMLTRSMYLQLTVPQATVKMQNVITEVQPLLNIKV